MNSSEEETSLPAKAAAAAQLPKQPGENETCKYDQASAEEGLFGERAHFDLASASPSASPSATLSHQEEPLSSPERTLDDSELQRHGMVTREGDMISFVADNFQERLRQSLSPSSRLSPKRRSATPDRASSLSARDRKSSLSARDDKPAIDPKVLDDLEIHARRVAESLERLLINMQGMLHNMSAVSVGYIQTYRDSVDKMGETADNGVKAMYVLIAKCEELNRNMEPMYELHKQIKNIKELLTALETQCK